MQFFVGKYLLFAEAWNTFNFFMVIEGNKQKKYLHLFRPISKYINKNQSFNVLPILIFSFEVMEKGRKWVEHFR